MKSNRVSLAVVRYPDGWRILARDRRWGRFEYRVDAEEAALRLAEKLTAAGQEVEVVSQDLYGRLETLRHAS